MKKISLITFFASCILFLFFSCKKEIVHTSEEVVTSQLKEVIEKNGVTRILAWTDKRGFPDYPSSVGNTWKFSEGFISIYGMGTSSNPYLKWNLIYMDSYSFTNRNDPVLYYCILKIQL